MQGLGEGVSTDQVGEFFKQIGIIKVSNQCHIEDFIIVNILIKMHVLPCLYNTVVSIIKSCNACAPPCR